jgi:hypothetical protein
MMTTWLLKALLLTNLFLGMYADQAEMDAAKAKWEAAYIETYTYDYIANSQGVKP